MRRVKYTLKDIQLRIDERFPRKRFKVLEFSNTNKPFKMYCPKHGEQTPASFTSFMFSKHGCPMCGRIAAAAHASERMLAKHEALDTAISALYNLSPLLSDAEFRQSVSDILSFSRQKPPAAKQAAEQPEPRHPEGFVPVPGFPDYSVSRDGRAYGLNEKAMLHGRWHPAHGMTVTLHGKRLSKTLPVARLVYSAFHPGVPLTGFVVLHKNGDYADNSLDNLYLAAESEKPPKREVIVYDKESRQKLAFPSIQSAAAAVGASTVSAVSRRLKDPELRKTPINGRYEVLGYGR